MESHEPILLICHGFPPVRGIGGRRWAKFAKELARRGHPVHVIRNAGTPGRLDSLWTADGMQPGIVHHPLPQRYPTVLAKRPITRLTDKLMYRLWCRLLPLLTRGNWRDSAVLWKRPLLRLAGQLVRQHGIRHVIVTGAPFSLLGHALALHKAHPGIRLIADLRDAWTWAPGYGIASLGPRRLQYEKEMESQVVAQADLLISPHEAVIDHLRRTYPGRAHAMAVLPHAVDPADFDASARPAGDGIFRMIYAGSLYGVEEADAYFAALLRAFEALRQHSPGAFGRCRLDLYITGTGTAALEAQAHARGLADHIRFHAPLPPRDVFRRVAQADLVLAFIPRMNRDILGTKFNELFYLGRPVLHIGEPGLVSRTITGRRLGASLRVEELETELPRIIRGERRVETHPDAEVEALLLPRLSDRLLREVLAGIPITPSAVSRRGPRCPP